MAFYWFGDSWVYGDELEKQTNGESFKNFTFAKLVSDHYEQSCINLSVCGGSNDLMLYEFYKIYNRLTADDTVFFLLTADYRTSFFDELTLKNVLPHYYSKHNAHPHCDIWYKFFDSKKQSAFQYDRVINLIYLWCKQIGVDCRFANLFAPQNTNIFNVVPPENWLLPQDQCLAKFILPVTKDQQLILDDCSEITELEWAQQKPAVDQYIRPNYCHPNIDGHEKIANGIINILNNE